MLRVFTFLSLAVTGIALSALLWDIISQGATGISVDFLRELPQGSGRAGGISSIIASTTLIVFIAVAVSLPIGLLTSVFLTLFCESNSRFATCIRMALDLLASTPSIVFGLFGSAFFCLYLGFGFSLLSGGLTLAFMILPFIVRFSEASIRELPEEHLNNAYSLGFTHTGVFFKIILPLIAPALTAAIVLSVARALSETAALLFTSGYVSRMPSSLFDSGRTLSVHIFDLSMNVPGGEKNAYSSALVLIIILVAINTATWLASTSLSKRYGVVDESKK
jgi:phosphate transport system permease protein